MPHPCDASGGGNNSATARGGGGGECPAERRVTERGRTGTVNVPVVSGVAVCSLSTIFVAQGDTDVRLNAQTHGLGRWPR